MYTGTLCVVDAINIPVIYLFALPRYLLSLDRGGFGQVIHEGWRAYRLEPPGVLSALCEIGLLHTGQIDDTGTRPCHSLHMFLVILSSSSQFSSSY